MAGDQPGQRLRVSLSLRNADHRTVSLIDGLAAFWLVLWLVVAGATASQVWQLSAVSDSANVSAGAVNRAGQALSNLSDLPVVGGTVGEVGTDIRSAATDIARQAEETRSTFHRLSVLLGLSLFLIPTAPVLGFYLPMRLRRRRAARELRGEVEHGGNRAGLESYLAHRALASMTYRDLLTVTDDPAGDLARGRHRALADAELDRLGLPGFGEPSSP